MGGEQASQGGRKLVKKEYHCHFHLSALSEIEAGGGGLCSSSPCPPSTEVTSFPPPPPSHLWLPSQQVQVPPPLSAVQSLTAEAAGQADAFAARLISPSVTRSGILDPAVCQVCFLRRERGEEEKKTGIGRIWWGKAGTGTPPPVLHKNTSPCLSVSPKTVQNMKRKSPAGR